MYINTTSNMFTTIENKTIKSKKNQAKTIPYFFTTTINTKKENTNLKVASKKHEVKRRKIKEK